MKVCIIGNGLIALTLAKALVNRGIYVDVFHKNKEKKHDKNRSVGISESNINFFNKNIINLDKIQWQIKKIKVFTENLHQEEVLSFSNAGKNLFSVFENYKLYNEIERKLKYNKFFKYKTNLSYNKLIKLGYKLIINCDFFHEITKKFFYKSIVKDYNSSAHTTILTHKKIFNNNVAVQIFTRKGPIAFLPLSNTTTSVVCSLREKHSEIEIENLIKKFNPNYSIIKRNKISKFSLNSSNLRKYYKDNILAFGDILHKIHPLAGQGFNMSLRDIKELIYLIDKRKNLGLDLDNSICVDFQKKTKNKNFIFSEGIDFIYEIFNFESKFKSKYFSKSLSIINKNKFLNNFLRKYADEGLQI